MSLERILEFATTYGYGFLFVTSVAENTFLLGLVVPGTWWSSRWRACRAGSSEATLVAVVVIVGTVLGLMLSFVIGRRGGIPLIERWGSRFHSSLKGSKEFSVLPPARCQDRFGAAFVSGLKNLVPAVAGASEMGLGGCYRLRTTCLSGGLCWRWWRLATPVVLTILRALDVVGRRTGGFSALSLPFGRAFGAASHSKSAPSPAKLAQILPEDRLDGCSHDLKPVRSSRT